MHYFVVRETRPRIRFPIGLRRWIYPVSYADRQNLSIRSSFIALLEQFPQLTLLPMVSETGKTNLRIQGTPFREHLVEHGFFQYAELVILTLMKGDE